MRVLIVEDDLPSAEAIRMRLEKSRIAVDVVSEGYAALDALRVQPYDALVLDLIITAGLNGFGVLNFVELEMPEMLERVFVVSGMSEQTIMNTAPSLLPRFFRKPYDERRLLDAIEALRSPEPAEAPPPAPAPCVLIAEDDENFLELLRISISHRGYNVRCVKNGRDAIERLTRGSYDAFLLDIVMPELDGFAVLRFLEETQPQMLRRTILMTALPANYRRTIDVTKLWGVAEKSMAMAEIGAIVDACVGKQKAPG